MNPGSSPVVVLPPKGAHGPHPAGFTLGDRERRILFVLVPERMMNARWLGCESISGFIDYPLRFMRKCGGVGDDSQALRKVLAGFVRADETNIREFRRMAQKTTPFIVGAGLYEK